MWPGKASSPTLGKPRVPEALFGLDVGEDLLRDVEELGA
jgi:hypothetical protein